MILNRRTLLGAGLIAAATTVGTGRFTVAATPQGDGTDSDLATRLDGFVEQYMRDMHAPAMTLVLADRSGVQRVASYGLGDVERHIELRQDELFHIGSISKSFVALCLLQLRDEGKLDLDQPIIRYLPWLRLDTAFAPITVHHLLTHGSGLPGDTRMFPSDPTQRHHAAYAPGEHFHYSNLAFEVLGHLVSTLDGRQLPESIRRRILEPLGMTQTEPAITLDVRERLAKSYDTFHNDRPLTVSARLCEAPGIIHTNGAGCVASTARDMGAYIRMIAGGGMAPHGRLVSKESFALFCSPHISAKEFGPTASYGYGIAVDKLDGNTVVRHTGGMVSFASSMWVDLDAGVGAFASINAMQDYRPNPVARFAVQLMRARRANQTLPAIPPADPATQVVNAADFAGTYRGEAGRELVIEQQGSSLFLVRKNARVQLEKCAEPDRFMAADQSLESRRFPLFFRRQNAEVETSRVVELIWGSEWYGAASYDGPKQFTYPQEWQSYVGHYRNENPWLGSIRVLMCKGQLWLDGIIPLQAVGDRFYLRDEEHSPEWVTFGEIVNGRCMRIKFSGEDFWQVAAT